MRKYFFFTILVVVMFLGLFFYEYHQFYDGKLHVVFCDVGQGDGIFIRTPEGQDILVDAGPDSSIEQCLSKHMPFWERDITLSLLTHHHLDHYGGFVSVSKHYTVHVFVQPDTKPTVSLWQSLEKQLHKQKTLFKTVKKGERIHVGSVNFSVLNPYDAAEQSREDMNDESIVGVLSYKDFDVLLTGDVLKEASDTFDAVIPHVEVLKVPHHGSRNGLTRQMLSVSSPQVAVISDGKGNTFGHPHKETLNLLKRIKTLRTDMLGDVEVISDGKKFWLK